MWGEIELHLGSKGFFTVVCSNMEERDRIFDSGPYFFASVGLCMRPWMDNFTLRRKHLHASQFGSGCIPFPWTVGSLQL